MNHLTIDDIGRLAPAALATKPASHCSKQYTMIPTMEVVTMLEGLGFVPVAAQQDKAKPDRWGREKHVRHMLRFRMKGTSTLDKHAMMASCIPEVVVVNSSDGTVKFDMKKGIFRLICSNGLIVMDPGGEQVFQVHQHVTAKSVIDRARSLAANSKPLFDKIQKWNKIHLNELAQQRFAEEAMALRVGDEEKAKQFDFRSIIKPQRVEDAEPTLWNLFNRAQENGMRGLIEGESVSPDGSERRKLAVRPLLAIGSTIGYNEQLWAMAEKWGAIGSKIGVHTRKE